MPVPGFGPCFRCNGDDHWADNCPELTPPKDKAEHEARIDKYKQWKWKCRVTLPQGRHLIEHENKMWDQVKTGARK